MRKRWFLALLPLAAGFGLGIIFEFEILPNPILYLRADLSALAQIIGFIIAIGLWAWIVFSAWMVNNQRQAEILNAEERRRFLQRLDHELKNPLTAIQAGLANLNDHEPNPALTSVKAQTTRLSRLVADLRKLADLETRPIERSPVDLGEILTLLVEMASANAELDREINLSIPQAPWPLPTVPGDYDLILLSLHNLLDNALKFSRPGDTIEVRSFEDGQYVAVEIADTGPGIPESELPYVWQELYRGLSARGVPGSGLGLPLVRAIIERHGGQVNVRSRAGQGTVFGVRFQL